MKAEENVLMVRMMCGVSLRDKKKSSELMSMAGLNEDIVVEVRKSILRRCGHVLSKSKDNRTKKALRVAVLGKVGKGRPKLSWQVEAEKNMVMARVQKLEEDGVRV